MPNFRSKPPLGRLVNSARANELGLVGAWPLNEGRGGTVNDASGNNRTGTIINAPAWHPDGIDFETATDQYIQLATPIVFPSLNPWSFETVVNFETVAASGLCGNTISAGAYFRAFFNTTTAFYIYNDINTAKIITVPTMATNRLYSICVTCKGLGGVFSLYIDGKFIGTTNWADSTQATFYRLASLGSTTDYNLDGKMRHFFVFNKYLSAKQVDKLYADPYYPWRRNRVELWAVGAVAPPAALPSLINGKLVNNGLLNSGVLVC